MSVDYSRLTGRMRERGVTQARLAKAAHIHVSTLNQKLNHHRDFTQSEILAICAFLQIEDVQGYFFAV